MKVFQDLTIRGDHAAITQWLEAVSAAIAPPWRRDGKRERELPGYYSFAREGTEGIPHATLYLIDRPGGAELANIVPFGESLSIAQYNAILREFHDQYAAPLARNVGLELNLTRDTYTLEEAFPADVLQKLRRFSDVANKSTGAGHPLDYERWMEFLVAAHEARVDTDEGTLRRFLEEEFGWPEEGAAELASDYRSAMDLLRFYSGYREKAPEGH